MEYSWAKNIRVVCVFSFLCKTENCFSIVQRVLCTSYRFSNRGYTHGFVTFVYLLHINSEHCLLSACCELDVCDMGKINMSPVVGKKNLRSSHEIQCGTLRACWGLPGEDCVSCVCVCVPCRVEVCRPYPRVGDGYPKKMAQRNMRWGEKGRLARCGQGGRATGGSLNNSGFQVNVRQTG